MSAITITPQAIQQCRALLQDPTSQAQKIYASLKAVRSSLCNKTFEEEISVIMNSNLHISIFNYAASYLNLISDGTEIPPQHVKILQECLWIFTNLSMDQTGKTAELVNLGLINLTQLTLQLVKYPPIVQCTLQLIGNLAGEDSLVIKLSYLKSPTFGMFYLNYSGYFWKYKNSCDETLTWTLSNVFRRLHTSHPPMEIVQPAIQFYLPIIGSMLSYPTENIATTKNLYWIFFYITQDWDLFYPEIHQLIENKFDASPDQVKQIIIDIYGNMASQSDLGVKIIIESPSMMEYILKQLKIKNGKGNGKSKKTHKTHKNKVYAWILSNILAGSPEQIDYLLNNHSTFFNEMYEILQINDSYKVIKELIWAICNMIQSCTFQAFQLLYYSNILICLSEKLSIFIDSGQLDEIMARVYLEGIESYINKHSQAPEKFVIQGYQKNAILKTLQQIMPQLSQQAYTTRLGNAINYLFSVQAVQQMGALSLDS